MDTPITAHHIILLSTLVVSRVVRNPTHWKGSHTQKGVSDMSNEDNKALVRHRFEELDKGNFAVLDELFDPNYVLHFQDRSIPMNLEQTKQFYIMFYSAFPDLSHSLDEQIAEGDKVVTRWTARGTHRGEFMGIPATDKQITLTGINIYRLVDNKLAESHVNWDMQGLMQQLGYFQTPPQDPNQLSQYH